MSVANKERFVKTGLKLLVGTIQSAFPPPIVNFEGKNLIVLGVSNKEDLIPVNFDTAELQRIITFGIMKQFIYTTEGGDLYDVCLYRDDSGGVYIYGIRTRQLPEVKGAKVNNEEKEA